MFLNLAELAFHVTTLGPGNRIAIWVQGCRSRCPGCIEPAWRPLRANKMVAVGELAQQILAEPIHDGLTFSGGEPMLQAAGLLHLWRTIHASRPEWTLVLFSGLTRRQVLSEGRSCRIDLLKAADAFIGGPYMEGLNDGRGLRGSTNQEVIIRPDARFTEEEQQSLLAGKRRMETRFGSRQILLVGVPPAGWRKIPLFSATHPTQADRHIPQETVTKRCGKPYF